MKIFKEIKEGIHKSIISSLSFFAEEETMVIDDGSADVSCKGWAEQLMDTFKALQIAQIMFWKSRFRVILLDILI